MTGTLPKNIIFDDTSSEWFQTENADFTNGESMGVMSASDTGANTYLFVYKYSFRYFYNEKFKTE